MKLWKTLSTDSQLRDELIEELESRIAQENSLDRVNETHTFEYQRGKVAALRALQDKIKTLDRKDQ